MSREEALVFLAGERCMILGTLDPDGSPWGEVVASTLDGEVLYFVVARGGRSHANLERDPRACCSSDRYPSYYEIKGVTVHGRVRRVVDPAVVTRIEPATIAAAGPVTSSETAHDALLYALDLDDMSSFDFAKIRNKY